MTISRTRKKVISTALVCALMVVLAVGATLAYLTTTTEAITNNFTFVSGDDISATLTENNFDASKAQNLSAGATITKDPTITNTSNTENSMPEYVAMQVSFRTGAGVELTADQFNLLSQLISITWATGSEWVTEDGTNVSAITNLGSSVTTEYYYDTVLYNISTEGSTVTDALFTSVTINSNISNEQLTWLSSTATEAAIDDVPGLGGFQIVVNGAATQADVFTGNVTEDPEKEGTDGLACTTLAGLFE